MSSAGRTHDTGACLRIVHLFPDLLSVYGDAGNVRTIADRAEARGIDVELTSVLAGSGSVPVADILLIGGGQDREQVTVARELDRLGSEIRTRIVDGAAILAVCGGYQSLGRSYRMSTGTMLEGPAILDVETQAGAARMVGSVVAALTDRSASRAAVRTVVGFENHAGQTWLGANARPLATVEIGSGNNGEDGTEGLFALPGDGGLGGLRIGTYLHGPLLALNPHIADALISAGLAHGGPPVRLAPLDDEAEWSAHIGFAERSREHRRRDDRVPRVLRRYVDPVRSLIGY